MTLLDRNYFSVDYRSKDVWVQMNELVATIYPRASFAIDIGENSVTIIDRVYFYA